VARILEIVTNGRDGLAAVERTAPDLLVTDLAMPQMTGFALADAIRARPSIRHIPIMFITAKPFSPRDLREKIDSLLGPGTAP
jgi:CheY-like chemotaxis protein